MQGDFISNRQILRTLLKKSDPARDHHPAGSYSFVFEFEIFVYIPDHIRYQLSSAQGNNIVPAGFENSSVRYFSASSPFACAVEIREYSAALALAPLAVQ